MGPQRVIEDPFAIYGDLLTWANKLAAPQPPAPANPSVTVGGNTWSESQRLARGG